MTKWPGLALIAAAVLAGSAAAAPFEIKDTEGFGTEMTALTLDLPDGWQGQGRIAWLKPCSANELYEVVFSAASPDGQSGMRMMPGHQIVWNDIDVTGTDPMFAQISLQQAEQMRADMRQQFRDSNCHVGTAGGTDQILATLILPRRPAGVRVLRQQPDAARIAQFRQTLGAQVPGMKTDFDAVVVDLSYPGAGGEAVVERLWLAWYRFQDDPAVGRIPGLPQLRYQTVTVEAPVFVWAPEAQAGTLDALAAVIAGARADPVWLEKVRTEQSRRAEERRRTQAQDNTAREAARKAREEAADKRHRDFLGIIKQ